MRAEEERQGERGAARASGVSPEALPQVCAFASSGHLCSGDDS